MVSIFLCNGYVTNSLRYVSTIKEGEIKTPIHGLTTPEK